MKKRRRISLVLVFVLSMIIIIDTHAISVGVTSTSGQYVLYNKTVSNTGWSVTGTSLEFIDPTTKVTYRPYSAGDVVMRVSNAKTFTATQISGGQTYWQVLIDYSITHVNLRGNIDVAGGSLHKGTFTF